LYAIEVEGLTKHYRVYLKPFDRLKEAVTRRPSHELVEALSEVSFQVPLGDTLGIIGENGAGKSTLLKILAGTVLPTSGSVTKRGRIAALLELGSGFHPEFSGRRNIYLNAALLGLNEKEIQEREESIIKFAELEDVIERPVRTYSSGMYVRLGFSIATSVDPDVLIIDEALSVGDERFQKKCIDRMIEFRGTGKTIIFCSHSMYLINELCSVSVWLSDGRVCSYGKTSKVISEYLAYLEGKSCKNHAVAESNHVKRSPLLEVIIEEICPVDEKGTQLEVVTQFQTVIFRVRTRCLGVPIKGHLGIWIEQFDGEKIFGTTTKASGLEPFEFIGEQILEVVVPSFPILEGKYRARAKVGDKHALRLMHELSSEPFIVESDRPESGMLWMEHFWRFPDPDKPEKLKVSQSLK